MANKLQLSGGNFQDSLGNVVANGYILMQLSQDSQVNSNTQLSSGIIVKVLLDSSGNVVSSPAQSIWGTDVMTPTNTVYQVQVFDNRGELVWGPNYQTVTGSSPFNVGTWVPNAG